MWVRIPPGPQNGWVALVAEKSGLLIQCRKTAVGSNPTPSSSIMIEFAQSNYWNVAQMVRARS
jgi:hypothetical protein